MIVPSRCDRETCGLNDSKNKLNLLYCRNLVLFALLFGISMFSFITTAYGQTGANVSLYRMYNPYSGEHFYTDSTSERQDLMIAGWNYEGIGWKSPVSSSSPVYRLYNPYVPGGDHHYTRSVDEYRELMSLGWVGEGIGWYSDDNETVSVYREYNPNAFSCNHNFTTSSTEHNQLVAYGWHDESQNGAYAWYAVEGGDPNDMNLVAGDYQIMGSSRTTIAKMVSRYKVSGHSYPGSSLATGGAPTIEDFCRILCEESAAEGVRAEVVFAQAMHETGWLQFGGDVRIEQFNFAGIGATGNGAHGNSFKDVREGLRAQVQHLKAYACTAPLNNACVDPRFAYVNRGCAPTVEKLAGKWAVDSSYGKSLCQIIVTVL